jgi:hypothetical protein
VPPSATHRKICLHKIGSRSESPGPQAWDAALAVYAIIRMDVGPVWTSSILPARQTARWLDIVLQPHRYARPALRLTG